LGCLALVALSRRNGTYDAAEAEVFGPPKRELGDPIFVFGQSKPSLIDDSSDAPVFSIGMEKKRKKQEPL